MFTKKELVLAKNEARQFIAKCTEYRALLTEHELPLSVNLSELTGVLRAQLFAKLLAVDAGLKMRFEMLRTEEAQQKLILETINLDGYPIVGELKQHIQQLQSIYSSLQLRRGEMWCTPDREGMSLGYLASHHGLDLTAWLQAQLIDWTGKEHVLAYFQTLGQQLNQVRALVRATRNASAGLASIAGQNVLEFFTRDSQSGPVEPDEHYIMGRLIPELQQQGKLAGFPGNMK